ncbi:MAG TPA: hypothetical protein VKP13_16210, partial [Nitrospira sp.]|nr:hypothetical protein [Nitrospira sp.]
LSAKQWRPGHPATTKEWQTRSNLRTEDDEIGSLDVFSSFAWRCKRISLCQGIIDGIKDNRLLKGQSTLPQ